MLQPEFKVDTARVRQLEMELLETRVLFTTTIDDYDIVSPYKVLITELYNYNPTAAGAGSQQRRGRSCF